MQEGSWEGVRSGSGQKLLSPCSRFNVSKGRKKKWVMVTKGYLCQETSVNAGMK